MLFFVLLVAVASATFCPLATVPLPSGFIVDQTNQYSPQWLYDGTSGWVVYSNGTHLYSVKWPVTSSSTSTLIAVDVGIQVTDGDGFITASANRVAYQSVNLNRNPYRKLMLVALDGSSTTPLLLSHPSTTAGSAMTLVTPYATPTRVVWLSRTQTSGPSQVFSNLFAGGDLRLISMPLSNYTAPAVVSGFQIAPSSETVVFLTQQKVGVSGPTQAAFLYSFSSSGGDITSLTNTSMETLSVVSFKLTDGNVVYTQRIGSTSSGSMYQDILFSIPATGGSALQLSEGDFTNSTEQHSITFSTLVENGIVVWYDNDNGQNLYSSSVTSQTRIQITTSANNLGVARLLTSDGSRVVWYSATSKTYLSAATATGITTEIATFTAPLVEAGYGTGTVFLSPDDLTVVYLAYNLTTDQQQWWRTPIAGPSSSAIQISYVTAPALRSHVNGVFTPDSSKFIFSVTGLNPIGDKDSPQNGVYSSNITDGTSEKISQADGTGLYTLESNTFVSISPDSAFAFWLDAAGVAYYGCTKRAQDSGSFAASIAISLLVSPLALLFLIL